MNASSRSAALALAAVALAIGFACEATTPAAGPQPPKSAPAAADEVAPDHGAFTPFLTSDRCALCHSAVPSAQAMTTATGDNVSPYDTWSATAMANSFRDPYWRAQVAHEIERAPQDAAAIESLCLTCHAPMAHHSARLGDAPAPTRENTHDNALAQDGVSCTVCHRTRPETLGEATTFNGALPVGRDATIFGPFKDPATAPMRMHTGFTPTHGAHISSSALCGSCHTLFTQSGPNGPFLEQAPYLEWRNSVYSDEQGASAQSRSCQECHMPDSGSMKIARNPRGFDFNIAVRSDVRAHTFVGGNVLLAEMLRDNAHELGVKASNEALERIAAATRAQLAHSTARVKVVNIRRAGGLLEFDVRVDNLTGHKLPSGYPSRRAWLDVEVRAGGTTIFESGEFDARGRLTGVADERAQPHYDVVERPEQVVIYELLAADASGRTTTSLGEMVAPVKDNRLLPRGWKSDGPHADVTAPVGVNDDDFGDGGDTVTYRVAAPGGSEQLVIVARLMYQPIPPLWADALRESKTPEAADFVRMYDAADSAPETIALTVETTP